MHLSRIRAVACHRFRLAEECWRRIGIVRSLAAGVNPLLRFPVEDHTTLGHIIGLPWQPAGVGDGAPVPPHKLRSVGRLSPSSNPGFAMVHGVQEVVGQFILN